MSSAHKDYDIVQSCASWPSCRPKDDTGALRSSEPERRSHQRYEASLLCNIHGGAMHVHARAPVRYIKTRLGHRASPTTSQCPASLPGPQTPIRRLRLHSRACR
jgi:hypothetical protein